MFIPADSGTTLLIDDVLGLRRPNAIMGTLHGAWRDTAFSLLALDGGENELFIMFEDATTDVETYGGGRYIDMPRPGPDGHALLDFNKAYTPPCAYTEFATCLIPPPQNHLPFAVRAGERGFVH